MPTPDSDTGPVLEFDQEECYRYIVEKLGREERLPARHNIKAGTDEMLNRLVLRYGIGRSEDLKALLIKHLFLQDGSSPEDKALWRAWRADYEITGNFSTPGRIGATKSRVMSWNSKEGIMTGESSRATKHDSGPLFLAEDEGKGIEWETRVDQANNSRPATCLLAEPTGTERRAKKLLAPSHVKHSQQQTPWEKQEFWAGSRIYNTVEQTINEVKGKLRGRR